MDRMVANRCAPKRALPLTLLCAALATAASVHAADPAPGSADDWHDGRPRDGSFRVRGPTPFEPLPGAAEPVDDAAAVQGVVATQPSAFGSVTKYVARCLPQPDDRRGDPERIEEAVAFWKRQAQLDHQRTVRIGSLAGVEFELSDPGKTLRVRVLAAPRRVCTLFVQWGRAAKPRARDIERFLASLELR